VADGAVKGERPANLFVRPGPTPISTLHADYHNAERVGGGFMGVK
jgi:hypothetical protein